MEQQTTQPWLDASNVDGKGKSIHIVQDVPSAAEAMRRVLHNARLVRTVQWALQAPDTVVWLWGHKGLAVTTLLHSAIDDTTAFLVYIQNEPGYSIKQLSSVMEEWAREQGAVRVATAVDSRVKARARVSGWKEWKVLLAKEI